MTNQNKSKSKLIEELQDYKKQLIDLESIKEQFDQEKEAHKILINKYNYVFETACDGTTFTDPNGTIIDCSKKTQELYDRSKEEIIGKVGE